MSVLKCHSRENAKFLEAPKNLGENAMMLATYFHVLPQNKNKITDFFLEEQTHPNRKNILAER